MPEIQYKFKSSLSFEIIKFSEPTITVGIFKDLINQKQSIKTSGFDLKLKDSHGKVYIDDDDLIDLKSKIIVSRVPKVCKPQLNIKKKDVVSANNLMDIKNDISVEFKSLDKTEPILDNDKVETEQVIIETTSEKPEQVIPDYLKCCLCNNLMKDAVQINCCKKNYCHECISGYLFDPDISGSLECPDCKSVVSNKDANLTDNSRIRSLIYDFKQGKLVSETLMELKEIINEEIDPLMHLENVHEIEIGMQISDSFSPIIGDQVTVESSDNVEVVQLNDIINSQNSAINDIDISEFKNTPSFIEPIIHNIVVPKEIMSNLSEISDDNIINDISQIADNCQRYNYNNSLFMDNQFDNRSGIPVINTSHLSETKSNDIIKESSNIVSINDLQFDPVIYMKFLKIVGETCPDELAKILSNNNDSIHINKDNRKISTTYKHQKDDNYYDKHMSKKSKYDNDNDNNNSRYKKTYNFSEKHFDNNNSNRYYDNTEKKTSSRGRSRSKEHYQKKIDGNSGTSGGYVNNRRSRDYEVRERDYYHPSSNNGPRYRNAESQNYQEERHNKYNSNYNNNNNNNSNSMHNRIKSNKYKRPMDR